MTTPDPATPGDPEQPVPVHVVPGPRGHGVDLCARQLAESTGARVVGSLADLVLDRSPAHLHVTDRIWGSSPEDAALHVAVACLARPTTLTLHDLPQAHDGASFERRSHAYAAMARAAVGVVVSSQHERGLLESALELGREWVSTEDSSARSSAAPAEPRPGLIEVVPLPLVTPPASESSSATPTSSAHPLAGLLDQVPVGLLGTVAGRLMGFGPTSVRPRREEQPAPAPGTGAPDLLRSRVCTIGLAGWFYPGKGHLAALGAAVAQRRRGHEVDLVVLGAPSPGHEQDAEELVRRAARLGVRVEVTGWLSEADLTAGLRAVDVPFVGHRNVSASGSLNSWLAAGRRPIVRRSAYFEEMERLRPDTLTLVRTGELAAAVGHALDDPSSTWLRPGTTLGHDLADAATAYRAFWNRALQPRHPRGGSTALEAADDHELHPLDAGDLTDGSGVLGRSRG
ncbi:MAG: hypothetical protein JWR42_656 [Marmoricola sp.]|nr:hypothetical protein [Marmoricola sp.]